MLIELAERAWLPDALIRLGIRRLLTQRLAQERADDAMTVEQVKRDRMEVSGSGALAVAQDAANDQHYEVPAAFYQMVLGPHLKYSACLWEEGVDSLRQAEEAMLRLTCRRAELHDGQDILELGCGWGSLSLWMARQYPRSRITVVSNSASQKAWIDARASEGGLTNLQVITADVTGFDPGRQYDRVVSVEMFEHMRNHAELMRRIAGWLKPDGRLFVHIFCHRNAFYAFEDEGQGNWMSRTFFTGGVMPSYDLLSRCQDSLPLVQSWRVNGRHYSRTLEAWLDRADEAEQRLIPLLEESYGPGQGRRWLQRWRIFFMACSELFGYGEGEEWFVGHYLFRKPGRSDLLGQ